MDIRIYDQRSPEMTIKCSGNAQKSQLIRMRILDNYHLFKSRVIFRDQSWMEKFSW